jgi:ubiquinone/menaquinone biosynthesis C-methylase UbiE
LTNTVLRANAIPLYAFLSYINARQLQGKLGDQIKILDCGAGGPVPPLVLFHEQGFETWGIDISNEQLELARQYCNEKGLQINFRQGDMCRIPFDDENFDCVYEHYSMCHLSKVETAKAISEMHRVTRKQGLCFLGVISTDSWPKSSYGEEKEPGEFWLREGADSGLHSMFTDEEADQLVGAWKVLSKEKRVIYLQDAGEQTTIDAWMDLYAGMETEYTKDEWRDQYKQRANKFNYSHLYYFLEKL